MSKAEPQPLYHVPQVPLDPGIHTYTRFFLEFEPLEYTNWMDECMSWKKTCFIGDWSPLFKLVVSGPDALKFFSRIAVNSFGKFEVGQAKHAIFCNEGGKIVGEGVLMRLAEDRYMFSDGLGVAWAMYQFMQGKYDAQAELVTEEHFVFQVQGPNSLHVLEKAMNQSLRDIGFMRFREASLQGMKMLVLRQGMAGELGYELHGSSHEGRAVYNAILEAGKEFGIRRLGGRSKMVNHVEACFPTPTVDFLPAMFGPREKPFLDMILAQAPQFMELLKFAGSATTRELTSYDRSPYDLGWGKNVKFDHDFIGREALEAEAAGTPRTMVTLVWNAEDVNDVSASFLRRDAEPYAYMEMPRSLLSLIWMDKVLAGGQEVGISSSRCYSYHFREMISLCTIDRRWAEPGTEVTVLWGDPHGPQKAIRARVAPAPYKQDNRRIDVATLPSYIE